MGIIISCANNKEIIPEINSPIYQNVRIRANNTNDGPIELGKKLTNPYSAQNMNAALKELQKTKPEYKTKKIETTHNYVRIESLTEEALFNLQDKEDIDLFIYPLDYEVVKSGNSYKEKNKNTKFQVYWAAVPVDYKIGKDYTNDILEKLYVPQGTRPQENSVYRNTNDPFLVDIEDKSLTMFDPKYIKPSGKARPMANVNPSGTMRVYDDFKNVLLPVEGLTIRGKRWFTVVYTPTNSLGSYQFSYTFNGPVDLSFNFESAKYELRIQDGPNSYAPATVLNNNVGNAGWSLDFYGVSLGSTNLPPNYSFNPDVWRLAHTWRAAYTYYYKNNTWSLDAPPQPNSPVLGLLNNLFTSTTKLKIGVRTDPGINDYSHTWMTPGLQGGVHIVLLSVPAQQYQSTYNYTGLDIFGTTIHELTHAQHFGFGLSPNSYLGSKAKAMLAETYALAVEYRITMDEYNIKNSTTAHANVLTIPREYDYKKIQERQISTFTTWVDRGPNAYTGACIDLMDTHNQGSGVTSRLNENLSGVSISSIQAQVKANPENWKAVKLGLISNYPFVTNEINSIFNSYAAWDSSLF